MSVSASLLRRRTEDSEDTLVNNKQIRGSEDVRVLPEQLLHDPRHPEHSLLPPDPQHLQSAEIKPGPQVGHRAGQIRLEAGDGQKSGLQQGAGHPEGGAGGQGPGGGFNKDQGGGEQPHRSEGRPAAGAGAAADKYKRCWSWIEKIGPAWGRKLII